ncbi:MAG: DUF3592 domain-containing protein [Rhodocyclaceae bacterium]|nr:DUF3592 domain-containing protein [Rhodocyclaceae bacterium]
MKSALLALAAASLLMGAFLGYVTWTLKETEKTLLAWPTVPGTIRSIAVEARPKSTRVINTGPVKLVWMVVVSYDYEVGGKACLGDKVSNAAVYQDLDVYAQPTAILTDYLTRYPAGSSVTVHYNPAQPQQGYLELDVSGSRMFLWATLVAGAVAVIALAARVFLVR